MTRALATGRAAWVTLPRTSRTGGTGVSDRAGAAAAKMTTAMANVRNRRINLLRLLKADDQENAAPGHLAFPGMQCASYTWKAEGGLCVTDRTLGRGSWSGGLQAAGSPSAA